MSEYRKVTYKVEQGIARITLNRPERRNALDQELLTELRDALRVSAADDSVRVVVVPAPAKTFAPAWIFARLPKMRRATSRNFKLRPATWRGCCSICAVIHAPSSRRPRPGAGGGCGIATAADIVLASDSAQFGYPEINIGFVPAIVMAILGVWFLRGERSRLIATGESDIGPDRPRIRNDQSSFRRGHV